jgi:hypothetical protein
MVLSAERAPLFHLYDDLLLFLVSGHDDPPCLDRFPKARAVKFANKNYITKTENDSECCWIEQLFLDWTLNTGSYRLESSPELVVGCILRLLRLFFIDLILTRRSCKVHRIVPIPSTSLQLSAPLLYYTYWCIVKTINVNIIITE